MTPFLHSWRLWLLALTVRIFNACIITTYFDPDEYWQSIEVAHQRVFGYGYLTWEWTVGLRSCLYLLPFIGYFQSLRHFGLEEYDTLVIYGPRVLQAMIAASIDYFTYLLAFKLLHNRSSARAAFFLSLLNWFNFSYLCRTLSNTLESLLSVMAACFWPMQPGRIFLLRDYLVAMFLIGLAVLVRPSAIMHWLLPALILPIAVHGLPRKLALLLGVLLTALPIIGIGFIIDSQVYGMPTLSWLRFFKFNILNRISSFYGTNPWHFYLLQTLPMMMGTMTPLVLISFFSEAFPFWSIQFLVGSLLLNSLLPHKEHRFLSPLLPILLILAAHGYQRQCCAKTRSNPKKWAFTTLLLTLLMIINMLAAYYFTRVHQRGVVQVIDHLRKLADSDPSIQGIFFAMPCHSTPYYGYLHRAVPMRLLTCHPPFTPSSQLLAQSGKYLDESDIFYENPAKFLEILLSQESPSHIVLFEHLLTVQDGLVMEILQQHAFSPCWRAFNSHFSIDSRRSGDVIMYCKTR